MSIVASSHPLPTLWRTKLRSTVPGVDHYAQVKYCLHNGLIGIGWRMDELPPGSELAAVLKRVEERIEPGWGAQAA